MNRPKSKELDFIYNKDNIKKEEALRVSDRYK